MFSYGFYDSLNGDRKYNARQMSEIFDGIINDGIYASIGNLFAVRPGGGLSVIVGTGRAWFNHTWNKNDNDLKLSINPPDVISPRYDAVVLEVDRRTTQRRNSIKIVQGAPSANPAKPVLLNGSGDIWQHPLAYVKVLAKATSISASQIENAVGTSACPFVTGIIETTDIDVLFQQWEGEFTDWFENVQAQLTNNVVTNLQYQIDHCVKVSNKASQSDVNNGTKNKWVPSDVLKTSLDTINNTLNTVGTNANNQIAALSKRIGTGGKSCRIAAGSYVGEISDTNVALTSKKTLTFGFYPIMVFMSNNQRSLYCAGKNNAGAPFCFIRPYTAYWVNGFAGDVQTGIYSGGECSWTDNSITYGASHSESFPNSYPKQDSLNMAGVTYYYYAIGYDLNST